MPISVENGRGKRIFESKTLCLVWLGSQSKRGTEGAAALLFLGVTKVDMCQQLANRNSYFQIRPKKQTQKEIQIESYKGFLPEWLEKEIKIRKQTKNTGWVFRIYNKHLLNIQFLLYLLFFK